MNLKGVVFGGVIAAAALLRLPDLGTRPLDDREASLALAAAAGTPNASAFWDSAKAEPMDPGYTSLTSLLFQAVGPLDSAARVVPELQHQPPAGGRHHASRGRLPRLRRHRRECGACD